MLQSAFLSCHFQQVPGATTFPLATPSQKSWSFSEDPGISGMCWHAHAPHYRTTNGFVRSGLWLKKKKNVCPCPRKEDKGCATGLESSGSSSRAGRFHDCTQPSQCFHACEPVLCKSSSTAEVSLHQWSRVLHVWRWILILHPLSPCRSADGCLWLEVATCTGLM